MGVAGDVALDRLDLDDLCPQIGEQLARIGAEHHRPDLDNPDPLQQRYHHPLLQVFVSILRQYCPLTDLSEKASEGLRDRRSGHPHPGRSEEHTSELQSLMRISYAVFCLKKKKNT